MEVSFSYFWQDMAGNPILCIMVLFTLGYFCKRLDRCAECDCHLRDNSLPQRAGSYFDERCV